jgi:hypothetical protein
MKLIDAISRGFRSSAAVELCFEEQVSLFWYFVDIFTRGKKRACHATKTAQKATGVAN